jgi:GH25 family lysozyme M1 (1,4-beta-N-acetylmuramidase)
MFDQPIRSLATRTLAMGVLLTAALLLAAPAAGTPVIPTDGHASAGKTGDSATASVAAPSGYSAQGVDVSHHQNTINWASVAASGQKFSYAKTTEGVSFLDPNFNANNRGAKQNGLYAGAYTFARPDRSNGRAAADYLVDHAQWAADGRTSAGSSPARRRAWCTARSTRHTSSAAPRGDPRTLVLHRRQRLGIRRSRRSVRR